jgi:hypothetical protein
MLAGTGVSHDQSDIKAAAVHMVFASRTSQDFITPQQVVDLESWAGQHILSVLSTFDIHETVRKIFLFTINEVLTGSVQETAPRD